MRIYKLGQLGSMLVMLITIVLLARNSGGFNFIWDTAFATVIFASLVSYCYLVRLQYERHYRQLASNEQVKVVHTLSYLRHDWSNDLQLIFGYVRLKKEEQLVQVIDRVKTKLTRESAIFNLGIPALALYLLAIMVQPGVVRVQVLVEEKLQADKLPIDHESMTAWTQRVMETLQANAEDGAGENNDVTLEIGKDHRGLLLSWKMIGKYSSELLTELQGLEKEAQRNNAELCSKLASDGRSGSIALHLLYDAS